MRRHLVYFFVSCLLFEACVAINNNAFVSLSNKERKSFRRFSIADAGKKVSYADSCVLQTINHRDLSELSKQYPALWVHYFAPWCHGQTCEDMGRYQRTAASYGPNVKLVLVSVSYRLDELKNKLTRSGIDRMVYVLDTCYSSRYNKAMRQFYAGIKKGLPYSRFNDGDDFIIRNDSILYMKDSRKPDSVFQSAVEKIVQGEALPTQVW